MTLRTGCGTIPSCRDATDSPPLFFSFPLPRFRTCSGWERMPFGITSMPEKNGLSMRGPWPTGMSIRRGFPITSTISCPHRLSGRTRRGISERRPLPSWKLHMRSFSCSPASAHGKGKFDLGAPAHLGCTFSARC